MNRAIAGAALTVIMACGAFGQAAATPPSFEVASIKAAAPMVLCVGGPVRLVGA